MSTVDVFKVLPEQQCIVGWASVATVGPDRRPVVDGEGDIIEISELHDAVLEMQKSANRTAKLNHSGGQVGEIVGSLVLDAATAEALKIQTEKEGWIVQIFISDPEVWAAARKGELAGLSIGGSAERV